LERIRDENWLVLVAVIDQQIVGYCLATIQEYPPVYIDTRYGYIQDIAVTEKYRRDGFGARLFGKALEWLTERGISRVQLDAAANNPISRGFWMKMGFRDFMIRMSKEI